MAKLWCCISSPTGSPMDVLETGKLSNMCENQQKKISKHLQIETRYPQRLWKEEEKRSDALLAQLEKP